MTNQPMMRLAVDAAIERDGQLLLIEYADAHLGRHWGLPGGGVEAGETLHAALRREVLEETGATVTVGRLLLVNEYDPVALDQAYDDDLTLRLLFHCRLTDGTAPFAAPIMPDPDQIGIGWVPIAELANVPFFPRIAERLQQILSAPPTADIFNTKL